LVTTETAGTRGDIDDALAAAAAEAEPALRQEIERVIERALARRWSSGCLSRRWRRTIGSGGRGGRSAGVDSPLPRPANVAR